MKKAAHAGNQLLLAMRSVPEAARTQNHAAYLRQCVVQGAPSRARTAPVRERAKNHGLVRGYEQELLEKAWKDASYGAVLLCSGETPDAAENEAVEEVLVSSGVTESPLGRVPKQNPDRTISTEGRPINDIRVQRTGCFRMLQDQNMIAYRQRNPDTARLCGKACCGARVIRGFHNAAPNGTCPKRSRGIFSRAPTCLNFVPGCSGSLC